MVRESISYRYLKDVLKINNVEKMVDPAFCLKPEPVDCESFFPEKMENGILGINISPLIERYKRQDQDLIKEVSAFIALAINKYNYSILLIPHVIPLDGSINNNDSHYMKKILASCSHLSSKITLIPDHFNAAQLKYVIGHCRFFIGARTHATIAALSSKIPTISIAYSIKARGINYDLFGNENVVLPTNEISTDALSQKLEYLQQQEQALKHILESKIPKYQKIVHDAAKKIHSTLS
jgi:colanic acid/amylovoran biosynthesis protein